MDIKGPVKIGVLDKDDGSGRELHFDFTEEFRMMDLADQTNRLKDYLAELAEEISKREDADPNRAGMLLVQQIVEQMLPYVATGEMALSETIMVEIEQTPGVSLTDLLG